MKWKLDDSRPIWPQLKEQLVIAIVAGEYPMGGSFPTVRELAEDCLLYTSPSPRDRTRSRMPSSA